jgi:glycosyltransferase involved in cell wall biosynthesis
MSAVSVSVVTINRNGVAELARTISSVRAQTHGLQWVVIDGASTDGSQELIRTALAPGDLFVSEPDRGISDAFNKGIAQATGDAVIFLNAGDEFAAPDSLARLVAAWDRPRHRWIAGAAEIVATDGTPLFVRGFAQTPRDPLSLVRTNCQIVHQTVLAERQLFSDFGLYDERWKVAMDYDLWVRWLVRGVVPQLVPVPVCRFHRGGVSGDPLRNHREWQRIRVEHGIANGVFGEGLLTALAWTKGRIRGRYGRWLYRLKERLGIRL